MEFLTAPQNLPFSVALGLMVALGLLEAVSLIAGGGISHLLDNLIGAHHLHLGVHHDGHDGVHLAGDAGGLLGWLHVGRVPILMLLVVFLTAFGVLGLSLQMLTQAGAGFLWPATLASVPAFILSLPVVRGFGSLLVRVLPREESSAVSGDSLIGRVAVITHGTAEADAPAEARVADHYGQTHYVLVVPDIASERFPLGTEVLLVRREGVRYRAIQNPSVMLATRHPGAQADQKNQ